MMRASTAFIAAGLGGGAAAPPTSASATSSALRHGFVRVGPANVFFREAGSPSSPTILLLHGFANSSHYFRHLMPLLASRYRVVAPDMPAFGFTQVDETAGYKYTFAGLTETIGGFVDALGLTRYALYVFDYGAPVAFNLALLHPDRVTAIISQNGNAYREGLGEKPWTPLFDYWAGRPNEARAKIRARLTLDGVKADYFVGVADPSLIEPEAYWLDAALLGRPGNAEIQIDLKLDYKANIDRYPLYQSFLRTRKPRVLAIWGRNDPFFIPPGAEAYRRDVPDADIRLLDTGHFALETHVHDIASAIMSMA